MAVKAFELVKLGVLSEKKLTRPFMPEKSPPGALHHVCEGGVLINVIGHRQSMDIFPLRVTVEL